MVGMTRYSNKLVIIFIFILVFSVYAESKRINPFTNKLDYKNNNSSEIKHNDITVEEKLNYFDTAYLYNTGDVGIGLYKFGDNSNYVQFDTNGRMTMVGDARVTDEIRIDAVKASVGSSAPTEVLRNVGESGTVKKSVSRYSKTVKNDVYFEFHAPESMDTTVNVEFHVVWIPESGWSSGNYKWVLEYLTKAEDAMITTGTPITISMDITPTNDSTFIETEFDSTIVLNIQETLIGHFYRDVANDNGDADGDVNMFEIKYVRNKQGH